MMKYTMPSQLTYWDYYRVYCGNFRCLWHLSVLSVSLAYFVPHAGTKLTFCLFSALCGNLVIAKVAQSSIKSRVSKNQRIDLKMEDRLLIFRFWIVKYRPTSGWNYGSWFEMKTTTDLMTACLTSAKHRHRRSRVESNNISIGKAIRSTLNPAIPVTITSASYKPILKHRTISSNFHNS